MKIRIKRFLFICFIFFISLASLGQVKETIIVKNRQPLATIVISPSASLQIQNAAKVLQDYIKRSTSALLPISTIPVRNTISINVGITTFVQSKNINVNSLDEDGFILQNIDANNFIIVGGNDWGTEFGVYSFLEKFVGVRWLMPTEIGIDIPQKANLIIPDVNLIDSPVYLSRQLSPVNIGSRTALGTWGRFNRLRNRIQFHHNMKKLFDPREYGLSNPSFYPLINGKRNSSEKSWQPNFSASGIVDSAANKIIRYFQAKPNENSYSLAVNDGGKYDQSEASKKRRNGKMNFLGLEDISDDYFQFVNEVIAKVKKVYPDKVFGLLAYGNVIAPPSKNIGVDSHVVPFITYERMRWADPQLKKQDQQLTEAWGEMCSQLGWYDYVYGRNYLLPRVWPHLMQEYLKWGVKHNVKYYYAELYPNWGEGPKPWIITKLLWNPDQNVDDLLNQWYFRFAGKKAAPKLKEYYSIWETFWTTDINKSSWNQPMGLMVRLGSYSYLKDVPESYISRSDALLNEAYILADSPERKLRVGKLKDMWELYKTAYLAYNNKVSNKKPLSSSLELINKLNELKKDSLFSTTVDIINKNLINK